MDQYTHNQNQLAWNSALEFGCAVLGNGSETILIDLQTESIADALAHHAGRGFAFAGVLGIVQGVPHIQSEPTAMAWASMVLAGPAFAKLAAERRDGQHLRRPVTTDDSLDFLNRLYSLEDDRGACELRKARPLSAIAPIGAAQARSLAS
jgi:hypothetical protein